VISGKPRLAFISPLFLFPNDAGGKIRTTNLLRGLKGGAFNVTLLSPATAQQQSRWTAEIQSVCDRFLGWEPTLVRPRWQRALDLLKELPVNVVGDRTPQALTAVRDTLADGKFDVAVFDFVHASVLVPERFGGATVCLTHNVEAEIFERHAAKAGSALMRRVWSSQHIKMRHFESESLRRFRSVVAVSERDAQHFREHYAVRSVEVIPTGVDLDFFDWRAPPAPRPDAAPTVVFTGSMDWAANVDGIQYFLDAVWPRVLAEVPRAKFVVVGRNAPAWLVERGRSQSVTFTGFVDDVRPHVHSAHAFVIPLRVGGGTRIKAFEAMAMGCPVVSTAIGIEGLDVVAGEHYLRRDSASDQAEAVVSLLHDEQLRLDLSHRARRRVEEKFGHRVAAAVFEQICINALRGVASTRPAAVVS
jgi:glycosyltransferase involved in cell wall biosynthesis